jgi:tetratricopeptide (TPR) repeat protein
MSLILISLLLQLQIALPPRTALANPALSDPVPKQFQKDYDKLWARFLSGKDDAKVFGEFEKLLKKNGEIVPALLVESYVDLYAGRPADAERRLQFVLSKSSTNPVALSYLAEFAYARGDFVTASDFFTRLRAAGSRSPQLETKSERSLLLAMDKLLHDAKLALSRNDLPEAEKLYRQAVQLAPQEPALREQLADVLTREGKREELETQGLRQPSGDPKEGGAIRAIGGPTTADLGRWGNQIERFHEIQISESLTREQLAAVLVSYFPELGTLSRSQQVLADVEQSWAETAIQAVVSVGLLDSMANHTFQPARTVTRGEFAACIGRLTRLLGVSAGTAPPIRPQDVVADSTLYRELQPVLGYGLMTLDDAGNFNVGASLRGEEAVNIAEKLRRLLQKNAG